MKKQSNPKPITCSANGYVCGGVCGFIIDGKYCGLHEDKTCMHQKETINLSPPTATPRLVTR